MRAIRSRLSWLIWSVTVLGLVAAPVIVSVGVDRELTGTVEAPILVSFSLFVLGFATTGALITSRQPANPVGWLCAGAAVLYVFAGVADSFVNSFPDTATSGGVLLRLWITVGESLWAPGLGIGATLLLLLFPNGHLPSPRWRPIAWVASVVLILIPVAQILVPGRVQDYPVVSPVGIPGAATVLEGIVGIAYMGLALCVPFSMASLFFRFRKAPPVERQQLKWLLFAAGLVAVLFLSSVILEVVTQNSAAAGEISNFLTTAALSAVPIAIGIAILRYRLYDIDVIINRALVYAVLTAVLAFVYIAVVFGLQQVLSPITQESDLAIAASTLAVAALFRPARTRVQSFIDHRFYRRKFDAQRTLDDFSSTLRDEVDLSALSSRLTGVISDTMQPAHVSLWLRTDMTP